MEPNRIEELQELQETIKSESQFVVNENIDKLTKIVWGSDLKEENFDRWSQGFIFDSLEKTALVQLNGGPCAIIVAVQAFLLKELLQSSQLRDSDWRLIDGIKVKTFSFQKIQ
jgi:hypothetical protein